MMPPQLPAIGMPGGGMIPPMGAGRAQLPPALMALLAGGQGKQSYGDMDGDEMVCPVCGQMMPQPFNKSAAPNMQNPQQGMQVPDGMAGQMGDSAMMAALMNGGGAPGGY